MECMNCSSELPANAKFCPACGSKVQKTRSRICSSCGEKLRPKAKFCQNCGIPVKATSEEARVKEFRATEELAKEGSKRRWLASVAPFLFIPIFAGIIILLFWRNRESTPLPPSSSSSAEQNMQSMAAMERVHKTVERLESRIEADPKDLVSIDSLAQMFYIAGSYDKASEYLKMHLDVEPDNRDVKMFLATTYGTLNRTDEAIALIKEILKEEPTYAFGLYNLGLIYAHQGNKDEALKNWKLLVQHYPGTDIAKSAQQQIHNLEHVDQPPQNQDR